MDGTENDVIQDSLKEENKMKPERNPKRISTCCFQLVFYTVLVQHSDESDISFPMIFIQVFFVNSGPIEEGSFLIGLNFFF